MSQTRPDKLRTRTLTGCYTCRERKLKCDDTRPACKRCIALGVECQGYGVKLSWLSYNKDRPGTKETDPELQRTKCSAKGKKNTSSEPAHRRRPLFTDRERVDMVRKIQKEFLNGDQDGNINRAIDDLDALGEQLSGRSLLRHDIGPFGVFLPESVYQPGRVEDDVLGSPETDVRSSTHIQSEPSPEDVPTGLFDMSQAIAGSSEEIAMPWLDGMGELALPWLDMTHDNAGATISDQLLRPGHAGISNGAGGYDYSSGPFETPDLGLADSSMQSIFAPFDPNHISPVIRTRNGDTQRQNFTLSATVDQLHWSGQPTLERIPRSLSNIENISKIPSEARFLLEYYSTEVVDYMCHLPNPQSPWRTIHFPCAMSTMADLLVFGSTNSARMALFYALLSISANHLGSKIPWSMRLEKRSQDATRYSASGTPPSNSNEMCNYWLEKGSSFQDMATAQIQLCLHSQHENYDDQEVYRELLMTLLSMVTISVTSGKLNSAHIYLQHAKKMIDMYVGGRARNSSFKSSKVAALHQIYSYLYIIYTSTHVSRALPGPDQAQYGIPQALAGGEPGGFTSRILGPSLSPALHSSLDSLAQHKDDYHMFVRIYGVPRSLLTLISKVSNLAKELEEDGQTPGSSSSSNCGFQHRCEALEEQICNWQPSDEETCAVESSSAYDPQIGSHLVQAMHDALVVTFFRRVRSVNRMVLQHYVESAADHLNDQEEIKMRTGINAPALLWPWFMVASEAIREPIRQKLRMWASLARRYGGRNLEIAEQVVDEVWRRYDQKLPYASWVDVVREWDATLVLT
ncbi:hypothetical protein A1O1_02930 [Capronia coronata CBS 617.96]|uniref:Zn(2)-C6 fungal-type domain-containing protein n=1 Tax=Capronia coronata CBS 617.96 TaxID=1182541 RepID=W9ZJ62_9EURO|nr:uncharacterized protein A1O1_02930 [Capronia coronata CBS 617.96]EXJ94534.1 hypothetical protein A1O1_02930 [Capronia coronata CBS 617.96]